MHLISGFINYIILTLKECVTLNLDMTKIYLFCEGIDYYHGQLWSGASFSVVRSKQSSYLKVYLIYQLYQIYQMYQKCYSTLKEFDTHDLDIVKMG